MNLVSTQPAPLPPEEKACRTCRLSLPATAAYFYLRGETGKLRNDCKACVREAKNGRYWRDPEHARAVARKSYHQAEGEGQDGAPVKKGVATKRRNREANPELYAAILAQYEATHATERKSARKERHWREKDDNNARSRTWYYENRGRAIATSRAWHDRNPEKARLLIEETRLRRKAAHRDLTTEEWLAICDRFGGLCAYCDAPLTSDNMEIDHVVPIAKGGDHTGENVVPACKPCNRSKAAKWLDEWLSEPSSWHLDGAVVSASRDGR